MYHWNQHNFEGLKSIGDSYSSIKEYEFFGQYCLRKEQGLKKLANASINEFVACTKKEALYKQSDVVASSRNCRMETLLRFLLVLKVS